MAWYWWLIIGWTLWAYVGFRRVWNRHDFLWWSFPIVFFAMYIWQPTVLLVDFSLWFEKKFKRKKN
uniref:Uncharacterized protein n=1 Tax=Pseudomonas phage HRDY3 TaxID=3236930 RepID=A0AB39CDP6_9VIRU